MTSTAWTRLCNSRQIPPNQPNVYPNNSHWLKIPTSSDGAQETKKCLWVCPGGCWGLYSIDTEPHVKIIASSHFHRTSLLKAWRYIRGWGGMIGTDYMEKAVLRLCEVEEMQSFEVKNFWSELAVHLGDSSVSTNLYAVESQWRLKIWTWVKAL